MKGENPLISEENIPKVSLLSSKMWNWAKIIINLIEKHL